MQTHHFCVRKSLLLITLICPIILISNVTQLSLIRKFYCFPKGPHISFKYARYNHLHCTMREKNLSKRSPLKHTCSWNDSYNNTSLFFSCLHDFQRNLKRQRQQWRQFQCWTKSKITRDIWKYYYHRIRLMFS